MKLMLFDLLSVKGRKYKIIKKATSLGDVVYIYLSKEMFNLSKLMFKLYSVRFKRFIAKDEYIYVISKKLEKYDIENMLIDKKNLHKVKIDKNTIVENSIRYLDSEDKYSHVVIVTNSISRNILEQYIKRFKRVSIYLDKRRVSMLDKNMISVLEKEYGIVINVITNDRKIECDIIVFLEDIFVDYNLVQYNKVYMLTENVLDKFSCEYEIYRKYKDEILECENYYARSISSSLMYLHNLAKKV